MPQAILLQDVESLGERGTVVDVSPGYLRNYLVPRKLAEPATKGSIEAATNRQEKAERAKQDAEDRARENAALLGRTVLTIPQQAGDDGRLFGSVTTQDIADAIRDARGIRVDRRKIHLEEPIRHVGTYMVVVEVADEVMASVKTMVVAARTVRTGARALPDRQSSARASSAGRRDCPALRPSGRDYAARRNRPTARRERGV